MEGRKGRSRGASPPFGTLKTNAFKMHIAQSRFLIVVLAVVLGPLRQALDNSVLVISMVLEATYASTLVGPSWHVSS